MALAGPRSVVRHDAHDLAMWPMQIQSASITDIFRFTPLQHDANNSYLSSTIKRIASVVSPWHSLDLSLGFHDMILYSNIPNSLRNIVQHTTRYFHVMFESYA